MFESLRELVGMEEAPVAWGTFLGLSAIALLSTLNLARLVLRGIYRAMGRWWDRAEEAQFLRDKAVRHAAGNAMVDQALAEVGEEGFPIDTPLKTVLEHFGVLGTQPRKAFTRPTLRRSPEPPPPKHPGAGSLNQPEQKAPERRRPGETALWDEL